MKSTGRKFSNNDKKETQAKKLKVSNDDCLINQYILNDNIRADLSRAFRNNKDFIHDGSGVSLHTYPFKHCIIRNFVKDEEYLKHLKEELLELQFKEKSNDLYKFYQSNDLKTSRKETISKLRKLLYKDCLDWMKTVTNIILDENAIDMSCAKYTNTDVLLCHDDELEGRRIAYIFYLVPPWTKKDGGSLDLFDINEFGEPDMIVKSLVPEWNSLVFFEVTPVSFHQVTFSQKNRVV
ncbi:prolyl 3-hydroxylase OGFOD1, partial [Paramuricea clavata]